MNCAQDFKDIQTEMATIVYKKLLKHDVEIEFDYFRIEANDAIISLNEPDLPIDDLPIPEKISKIEKLLKKNQDKFDQAYSIVFLVVDDDNMFYDGQLSLEYIIEDGVMNPVPNVVFSAMPRKKVELVKAPKTVATKNKDHSKKDVVEEIVDTDKIKQMVKKVTKEYMMNLHDLTNTIDDVYTPDDVEELMSDRIDQEFINFKNLAAYFLGIDSTATPKTLFWDFDTSYRDSLWETLKSNLPPKLFKKIDSHLNSFNKPAK